MFFSISVCTGLKYLLIFIFMSYVSMNYDEYYVFKLCTLSTLVFQPNLLDVDFRLPHLYNDIKLKKIIVINIFLSFSAKILSK